MNIDASENPALDSQPAEGQPQAPVPAEESRDSGAAAAPPDPLAAAADEAAQYRDRWLRAAADLDNFRKRTLKEREEWLPRIQADLLEDLLRVRDDFERALAHAPEGEADPVLAGFRLVYRHLVEFCERHAVTPIESVGAPFDPELHDAILQVERADLPPGTVVDEAVRGYRMGERVLRHAQVVVSKVPEGQAG